LLLWFWLLFLHNCFVDVEWEILELLMMDSTCYNYNNIHHDNACLCLIEITWMKSQIKINIPHKDCWILVMYCALIWDIYEEINLMVKKTCIFFLLNHHGSNREVRCMIFNLVGLFNISYLKIICKIRRILRDYYKTLAP
jgi:hypothetical protein